MFVMWKKVEDIKDIAAGDWVVILEDGSKGYLKARQGANCIIYVVNGHFHFDQHKVIAYAPFPTYNADDFHIEKEEKVVH